MKKNILYYSTLLLLMMVSLWFTSCDDEKVDTGEVRLEAFGPSPALRGSKITFIGQNLNKVTKVIFPSNIEVTDIELINNGEIKVVVPQNATVGLIKLIAGNVELTSKSTLSFTEPISISKISPSPVKAGQKLTIEGDYLNLIQKIVFKDNVEVKCQQFTTWERAKIELILPAEAQSGIIILGDTAAIPLELESEIELQVVLPSVDKVLDLTNKKPGAVITIPGKDLDLVSSIELPSGAVVPFSIVNSALVFTLPEDVTDGAIVMIPASNVRVAIANIGIAIPSELVAEPATGLRGGDVITVKGLNMELVTKVVFPGVTNAVTPNSKSATEIKVTMPDNAKSGNLVLNTASGKTASVTIVTLKPDVVAYNPSPVAAGSDVELQGHNFDLVASVTFGGDKTVNVTPSAADKLKVKVPVDAESGAVYLTMKNGETVACDALEITKPVFCYIPVLPGSDVEIKAGTILSVDIQNGDKLTNVQVKGANTQYILQGSTLYILIPSRAGGSTALKLISSNGEVQYTINVIGSGVKETVVWEGMIDITWSDGGRVMVPATAFDGVNAGSILKFYFQQKDAWGQAQINNGKWATIPFAELGNDGYLKTDGPMINNDKSVSSVELVLTKDVLANIRTNADGNAIIIQGSDWIFSKVSIITQGASSTSESIWTGSQDMGSWAGYIQLAADKFTSAKVGDVIHVKASVLADAQGSFKNGSWSEIAAGTDYFTITGDFDLTITDAILTSLQSGGLIVSGKNYTATEVTIVHN